MALGVPSVGEAGKKADLEPWSGTPPRDEFYWLSEINKATFVTNTAAGLLDRKSVGTWCKAQERVIETGNTPGIRARRCMCATNRSLSRRLGSR